MDHFDITDQTFRRIGQIRQKRSEQPSRDVIPLSDLTVLRYAKRSGSIFIEKQPNISIEEINQIKTVMGSTANKGTDPRSLYH